ncbi:trypsin-like serine peptidase [Diaphorobacter sp.]|uniref:trypsin-like serine peptidase n=1 Tax=Diaphorobacter sp. TaxID=1934310 RepID=UPI003D0D1436
MNPPRIGRTGLPLALAMALALTACGGGSDDGGSNGGNNGGGVPVTPVWGDRIEPYDPSAGLFKRAAQADGAASKAQARAAAARTVALGALGAQQVPTKAATGPGVPIQIGQARGVAATASAAATAALLNWQPTAHGTQVAALRFVADGARGVRLGVQVRALPDGAVLRFYAAPGGEVVQVDAQALRALAERNALAGATDAAARTYWSPDFGGPQTTLEVEIPAGAQRSAVDLAVPRLSHFTMTADEAETALVPKIGEAGGCNVDVMCRPEYIDQSRSVARMNFVSDDGGTFICNGTMLNDAASSGTPYFLSASHCIATQQEASSLVTEWFYRATSCRSLQTNPGATRLTGGATLLYTSAGTDVAFMRLNDRAPAGIVYAGSYFGGVATGAALAGVHNPQGDLQKVSLGTMQRYSLCDNGSCFSSNADEGNFLTLNWQEGTTEMGSSGSAVFITIGDRRYVVGQLFGGTASCTARDGVDYYGRFDTSYRAALQRWLNPGATR